MIELFCFVLAVLSSPFKSKLRLEAYRTSLALAERLCRSADRIDST
jgi:hypothetical protein